MSLGIYWDGEEVGQIERVEERSRLYAFRYTRTARPISLSLPLSQERFTPAESRPFFEALMPEGAVREQIARQLKLAAGDSYGLLAELGRDCDGALQIAGVQRMTETPSVQWLDDHELVELVIVRDLPASELRDQARAEGWHHPCIDAILDVIESRAMRVA